jgi:ribosomal protein L10
MSKYVKSLVTDHLRHQLENVPYALLVNVIGLNANTNSRLRAELREKNIHVVVVKNSLAARATQGTPLAPLFDGVAGTAAICWGSEDIVSLAKEITRLIRDAKFGSFEARGGVMDGEQLTAVQVGQVSKWPSRTEQLSILLGQILSPGALLASQLNSVGGALASQIEQKVKDAEESEAKNAGETEAKKAEEGEAKKAGDAEAKNAGDAEAKKAEEGEAKKAGESEEK